MDRSERHAGAVVFERGVLEAQRFKQLARDEFSRRVGVTAGHVADDPRQQHEFAVGVPPLTSGLCAQARICREGRLVGHVVFHLSVGLEEDRKSGRMQRLAAADPAHHA